MVRGQRVQEETVVTITYELRDPEGRILEERTKSQPCSFLYGFGQVLPALEESLLGKTKGFSTELTLSPERAYGPHKKDLIVEVPRSALPANVTLRPGMRFNTVGPRDEPITVEVTAIEGDRVVLDGNHPLAGMELHFQVTILDVRLATAEELRDKQVSGGNSPTYH